MSSNDRVKLRRLMNDGEPWGNGVYSLDEPEAGGKRYGVVNHYTSLYTYTFIADTWRFYEVTTGIDTAARMDLKYYDVYARLDLDAELMKDEETAEDPELWYTLIPVSRILTGIAPGWIAEKGSARYLVEDVEDFDTQQEITLRLIV